MATESRVAAARRHAASVKTGAAVAAVATFAAAFGLFRAHHAGASSDGSSGATPTVVDQSSSAIDSGDYFDGGDVTSSSAAPQVRTGAS